MARELLLSGVNMPEHILIIDDDPEFLIVAERYLKHRFRLSTTTSYRDAKKILGNRDVDYILLDIALGSENGLDYIGEIKSQNSEADIIVITGHRNPKFMIDAIRLGASDFLVKPFDPEEVTAIIEKLIPIRMMREQRGALLKGLNESFSRASIVGKSQYLTHQLEQAQKLKGQKAFVLIEGESGTGKELFARYIHGQEESEGRPFIAINCAAIPETLLESELFGAEKGSFTGAVGRKIGKFELANGGDLFLDEISALQPELQAKILRAIQEREITRIGGIQVIKTDFRVISASNENLEGLVNKGRFRRDLFHRLRVVSLKIPPLREREDDIPVLAESFLRKYAKGPEWRFTKSAMIALKSYGWPGNVRELENLVQSLVILVPGPNITVSDLPEWLFPKEKMNQSETFAPYFTSENHFPKNLSDCMPLKNYISNVEEEYVRRAIELADGDKTKVANILQLSRTRLYERLRLWGIKPR